MTTTTLVRPLAARREDEGAERRATWLELFFDLVFAAAVAEVGAYLGADYSLAGLAKFTFLFFLIWWAWIGHTFFSTRFDHDDLPQRLLTVGQVFAVAVMAVNTETDLASREAAGFAAAYAAMRILLAVQYVRVMRLPEARPLATRYAAGIAVAALLWLGSALVPPPVRFGLWAAALALDLLTPLWAVRQGGAHRPDPAHLPERFGLFTLILLGESVVKTMAGMKEQEVWTLPAAGAAMVGLAITFALWWAYFDVVNGAAPKRYPEGQRKRLLRLWAVGHLPLCLGIAVTAVGIEHVILLGGAIPLHGAAPWLLSGGLAMVIGSLGVIVSAAPEIAQRVLSRRALGLHAAVAAGVIVVGLLGSVMAPVALLALFFLACLAEIALTVRLRRAVATA
jgi:low temperature requirement protein LtrA